MDILLLSNSSNYRMAFLQHASFPIVKWLGEARRVLFIPYAEADHDGFTDKVQVAFDRITSESGIDSVEIVGSHRIFDLGRKPDNTNSLGQAKLNNDNTNMARLNEFPTSQYDPASVMASSVDGLDPSAPRTTHEKLDELTHVFCGGGNTFRLLRTLALNGLLDALKQRVAAKSISYLGSSAGTNIACPSIRTSNDMPIVQPPSFDSLGIVPFQINPHFVDRLHSIEHMGETRTKRLEEYLEENHLPVLCLPEGGWIEGTWSVDANHDNEWQDNECQTTRFGKLSLNSRRGALVLSRVGRWEIADGASLLEMAGQTAEGTHDDNGSKLELPTGWDYCLGTLTKRFEFKDFAQTFAFMTKVAEICERLNHHPSWSNSWNKVEIAFTSHDAGNSLTQLDIDACATINGLLDPVGTI